MLLVSLDDSGELLLTISAEGLIGMELGPLMDRPEILMSELIAGASTIARTLRAIAGFIPFAFVIGVDCNTW